MQINKKQIVIIELNGFKFKEILVKSKNPMYRNNPPLLKEVDPFSFALIEEYWVELNEIAKKIKPADLNLKITVGSRINSHRVVNAIMGSDMSNWLANENDFVDAIIISNGKIMKSKKRVGEKIIIEDPKFHKD